MAWENLGLADVLHRRSSSPFHVLDPPARGARTPPFCDGLRGAIFFFFIKSGERAGTLDDVYHRWRHSFPAYSLWRVDANLLHSN